MAKKTDAELAISKCLYCGSENAWILWELEHLQSCLSRNQIQKRLLHKMSEDMQWLVERWEPVSQSHCFDEIFVCDDLENVVN